MNNDPTHDRLSAVLSGHVTHLYVDFDGRVTHTTELPRLLLPGSFNPLHRGHLELAEAAERRTGYRAALELSIVNVDKPDLSLDEILRRLSHCAQKIPVWVTRTPRFVEKARLFPGVTFVLGSDTVERLIATRYYDDDVHRRDEAFQELRRLGCHFLVGGRVNGFGHFTQLDDLDIPLDYYDLFTSVSPLEFRVDCSSSAIRAGIHNV